MYRLTKTENGVVTKYAYNELNQLLWETGINYTYDRNGNQTSKISADQTTNYAYDKANHLISSTIKNGQTIDNLSDWVRDTSIEFAKPSYNPDPYARPAQKKQGREKKNNNRKKDNFEPRNNKRHTEPPKHHTPGDDHQKFPQGRGK